MSLPSSPVVSPRVCAGIDVGKATLAVALTADGATFDEFTVPNAPEGHATVVQRCQERHVQAVVLEATGHLEQAVAGELAAAGLGVSVVTPAQSKAFARALGTQAKTDSLDARLLALFALRLAPEPTALPSERQRQLRETAARRKQLVSFLVQEKNRLQQVQHPTVRQNIRQHVAFLETQLQDVDGQLRRLLEADPNEARRLAQLVSVPGIATRSALALLVHLPELGCLTRRTVASLAGVAPWNHDSGTHTGQRAIRGGRRDVRCGLYMPTWTAVRFNPVIREFYRRLVGAGKPKRVALIAAMRKFLGMLNSMLRQNKTWDEFYAPTKT